MNYRRRKSQAFIAKFRRAGIASGKAREAKRIAAGERDQEPMRNEPGSHLGVLQWHAADGRVRRWVLRQGKRKNQVSVPGMRDGGFDSLLAKLRKHLSPLTR